MDRDTSQPWEPLNQPHEAESDNVEPPLEGGFLNRWLKRNETSDSDEDDEDNSSSKKRRFRGLFKKLFPKTTDLVPAAEGPRVESSQMPYNLENVLFARREEPEQAGDELPTEPETAADTPEEPTYETEPPSLETMGILEEPNYSRPEPAESSTFEEPITTPIQEVPDPVIAETQDLPVQPLEHVSHAEPAIVVPAEVPESKTTHSSAPAAILAVGEFWNRRRHRKLKKRVKRLEKNDKKNDQNT